jgi:single-strand DNA-binding protein
MRDVNIVVLVGRLTRDAELKYTNSGQAICRFSVAVNRSRKQGDQWVDEASFFDVDYWGKGGEAVNQYLVKGKQVAIEGELRQDKWEQEGQARSKVVIAASNVQLLGGGQNSSGTGGSSGAYERGGQGARPAAAPAPAARPQAREPERSTPPDDFTDDIPF